MDLEKSNFNTVEIALILLALGTGIIHLYVGYQASYMNLVVAGLGFLGGVALFTVEKIRKYTVAAAIPFTAVQFALAYRSYGLNPTSTVIIDKIIQSALIILCAFYLYRNRS